MRFANELIANAPSNVSSNSNVMITECWIRASFQVDCTVGALNGTFSVRVSNDLPVGTPPYQFQPTYWSSLGSSSVVASISAGSAVMIPYFETCYRWHQVVFTAGNSGNTIGSYSIRAESRAL